MVPKRYDCEVVAGWVGVGCRSVGGSTAWWVQVSVMIEVCGVVCSRKGVCSCEEWRFDWWRGLGSWVVFCSFPIDYSFELDGEGSSNLM